MEFGVVVVVSIHGSAWVAEGPLQLFSWSSWPSSCSHLTIPLLMLARVSYIIFAFVSGLLARFLANCSDPLLCPLSFDYQRILAILLSVLNWEDRIRFPNLWLCLGCREERNPHSQILATPVLELIGQCPWSHSPCILLMLPVCVYQNVADL